MDGAVRRWGRRFYAVQRACGKQLSGPFKRLFCGLKKKPHAARQRGFALLKLMCHAEHHRGMNIVPAGVHYS